jgi:hypothetical protein
VALAVMSCSGKQIGMNSINILFICLSSSPRKENIKNKFKLPN